MFVVRSQADVVDLVTPDAKCKKFSETAEFKKSVASDLSPIPESKRVGSDTQYPTGCSPGTVFRRVVEDPNGPAALEEKGVEAGVDFTFLSADELADIADNLKPAAKGRVLKMIAAMGFNQCLSTMIQDF